VIRVAAQAECPIVVVRPGQGCEPPEYRIVAGIDATDVSRSWSSVLRSTAACLRDLTRLRVPALEADAFPRAFKIGALLAFVAGASCHPPFLQQRAAPGHRRD
jgi:hypothetical protein